MFDPETLERKAEEVAVMLFVWMGFLAAASTQAHDGHVRVTMLVERLPPQLRRLNDTLVDGLLEALETGLVRVGSFAHLRNAQDGTHPPYQAALARVSALHARVGAGTAFVESEILAFPEGLLEGFMAAEPGLDAFRSLLEELLELRPHRLGAEAERVLASLGEVLGAPYMIYNRAK